MRRYERYKDSGVEWLGEIPTHWECVPLRSIFKFRNEKNNPIKTDNILSLSIANGVTEYSDENRGGNKRKDDLSSYKLAYPNDIVLNSMNVIVGAVGVSKYFGAISPVYYALSLHNQRANLSYYESIFKNENFQRGLLRFGKGILIKFGENGKMNTIRMKISQDDLKKLYFPISPLDEQQKIAQFLDDKTAKIDRAVELAEKQIALLKEHKQILIQNAVTRGLNPDVPLKDSGVEWIGQVPEHWELTIGMNVFRENKRDNKGMKENTVLSLSYGKIIIKPEEKLFGLVPESFETYQIVEPNDIIIRCTDLQNDQTSLRTGLAQDKGIITSAYLNLKVINNYSAKFLHYYLHALDITKVLYKFGSGLRQNLSFLDFKRLPIIDISLAEQQQIADYLDKQTSKIDQAIALKTAHIEKLKEYKSVLINDVVTGKVRV
ncbi:TPA: restriction endonuclease subunit S [Haemophilus influenzae]|uniref:Probable type I restriction-modification system specificity protein n=1 Tax=Haemophilus influenzae TaxID=727 RepID=A9YUI0_HAEIF|nr:restriction endonuclease subunit S [Haemophilus influenzae]EDJ88235.1 putative type I site-specific restriction-modification system, S subunit [Haemophilus influenzae 22.1-21]ABY21299.1 probable type I restriction-modification system specificity protein [Haemophilus influenzae]ADO80460.1 Probable type I restriction modification system, specificity component HsdS2 [Haemophilus influenzae R2866]EDK11312.1 putative type I site-specific restriction-modification system, S subunit [Haemophilus inf